MLLLRSRVPFPVVVWELLSLKDLVIDDATAFLGGGVWTRTSILVQDGTITAVDDPARIRALAGPDAEVRDAAGRSVCWPGGQPVGWVLGQYRYPK